MKKFIVIISLVVLSLSCSVGKPRNLGETLDQSAEPAVAVPISTANATPSVIHDAAIPNSQASTPQSQCLQPKVGFNYQLGELPHLPAREDVLPPSEWQEMAYISEGAQIVFIQSRSDEIVVWVETKTGEIRKYALRSDQPETAILSIIPMDLSGSFQYLVDHENSVWAARYSPLGAWEKNQPALFQHYNESLGKFEPVPLALDNPNALGIRSFAADTQGFIWFLAVDNSDQGKYKLYRINPDAGFAEEHLTNYEILAPLALADDSLFIIRERLENNQEFKYELIRYELNSGTLKIYPIPGELYSYGGKYWYKMLPPSTIFVDSQDRIWVGARGWLDLSSSDTYAWHILLPNPVFIDILFGAGEWRWGEPEILHETTNGLLWYRSLRGTGWVDPSLGQWCVFTSYSSKVLADGDGNLWILVNERLYRRK